ncbi:MAG: L,D-transpeptidase [Spirochaetes bacterium]|nr:L,D-transpeptidase [Spirochaetota bacterium]
MVSRWTVIVLIISVLSLPAARCSGQESEETLVRRAFEDFKGPYVILVRKRDFSLDIVGRDLAAVAHYRIGYGRNPDGKTKLHEGDNRTPEGTYRIVEILSMDADKKTNAYAKLAAMNRVFFRAKDGHSKFGKPEEDMGDNAYGPRFFLLNYPNEGDRERYRKALREGTIEKVKGKIPGIGFGIAIHGNNDEPSIGNLCTSGCVRMYNSDIVELDQYVQIGTPVIIMGR